jgi:GAF domain-containing protein
MRSSSARHDRVHAANELLLDAARTFATSLELQETLDQVMSLVVPRLADYSLLYLVADDGAYRQAAGVHADPEQTRLLDELGRIHVPDPSAPNGPIGTVLATRRPYLAPTAPLDVTRRVPPNPAVVRIYRELKPVSYMVVPLVAHDELLGSLVLATSASGRQYDETDLELAELLGARAALAIDNARMYRAAREARDQEVKAAWLESQVARARLEALRAQLNPHFLFNALNVVAMLVRRGANDDALRAVVNLSELLRRVLASGTALEVPLREEMALVERYLDVEKLRFRDRLTVRVSITPAALDTKVPGLILQSLVENAIKHGVAKADGPGRVEILARHEGSKLLLRVCDNGPGFREGWDPSRATGVGLANMRERLERMYDGNYRLDLRRGDDGGAVVEIDIPLRPAGAPPAADRL